MDASYMKLEEEYSEVEYDNGRFGNLSEGNKNTTASSIEQKRMAYLQN